MPPRRRLPVRRARAYRFPLSPPAPAIETMEVEGSGEDMDVSEEEVHVEGDGASSEAGGAPEDEASGSEEDEIDVEHNEQDALVEDDEVDQEDELSSSPSRSPPPKPTKAKPTPTKPRLKIKLKFSGVAPSNATPTPSDEMPLRPGRKGHPKHVDVESEDDDDDDDDTSTPSTSYAGPTRLTQRQAALIGLTGVEEHIVLGAPVSKKKKYLNETELALKREETARKRKNLSAKKLEDEKIETINRLLKKQTRPRGKKAAIVAAEADEEGEQDGEDTSVSAAPPIIPTLFRWVSSSKPDSPTMSFSVPPSLMPESTGAQGTPLVNPPPSKSTPLCDVSGCALPRKYKLVRDPSKGGCGMEHLKALQVG